jgi:peptidyl-Lys metalloendopeptidase
MMKFTDKIQAGAAQALTALLVFSCFGSTGTAAGAGQNKSLEFRLEARESYAQGKPVTIKFTLVNNSKQDLFVLGWYTPLEGIKGRIFKVTRDGKEIQYGGMMAKRGAPGRQDYVCVKAGQSVSSEIDLAGAYDIKSAGKYHVAFTGNVHDVLQGCNATPRAEDAQQGMDVPGNEVTFRIVEPRT